MRERLAAVQDISAGVKEIVGRRNAFITQRCIEMPRLDVQAVADRYVRFQISLRQRDAIGARRLAAEIQIPVAAIRRFAGVFVERGNTEGLRVNGIGSEQEIEAPAKAPIRGVRFDAAFDEEIELIQLKPVGAIGEGNRAVETIRRIIGIVGCPAVDPAADFQAAAFIQIRQAVGKSMVNRDDCR